MLTISYYEDQSVGRCGRRN